MPGCSDPIQILCLTYLKYIFIKIQFLFKKIIKLIYFSYFSLYLDIDYHIIMIKQRLSELIF